MSFLRVGKLGCAVWAGIEGCYFKTFHEVDIFRRGKKVRLIGLRGFYYAIE